MNDVFVFIGIVGVLTAVGVAGGFAFGRRLFAWDDARAHAADDRAADDRAAGPVEASAPVEAETEGGSAEPQAPPSDTLPLDGQGGTDG